MLNVGVVWYSCGCGMLCFEMWWCEMVVGGRLRCIVRYRIWWSEVRCVATLNVAWNVRYVVM